MQFPAEAFSGGQSGVLHKLLHASQPVLPLVAAQRSKHAPTALRHDVLPARAYQTQHIVHRQRLDALRIQNLAQRVHHLLTVCPQDVVPRENLLQRGQDAPIGRRGGHRCPVDALRRPPEEVRVLLDDVARGAEAPVAAGQHGVEVRGAGVVVTGEPGHELKWCGGVRPRGYAAMCGGLDNGEGGREEMRTQEGDFVGGKRGEGLPEEKVPVLGVEVVELLDVELDAAAGEFKRQLFNSHHVSLLPC